MSQIYWIQTYTGKLFNLTNPTESMICIEDIAHHLSIENRFCGATKFPYSVGYHSILACRKAPSHLKLEALLHDAEEAYYKDLPTWWKRAIKNELVADKYGDDLFTRSIYVTRKLIANIFNLIIDTNEYKIIKEIDLRLALTERLALLTKGDGLWELHEGLEPYNDLDFMELKATNVEKLFLEEYKKWRRD